MEVIKDVFMDFLVKNKQIFVPGMSCVMNLLETVDFLKNTLSEGHNLDEILIDLLKAFNLL